jgi:hypothetical protein
MVWAKVGTSQAKDIWWPFRRSSRAAAVVGGGRHADLFYRRARAGSLSHASGGPEGRIHINWMKPGP